MSSQYWIGYPSKPLLPSRLENKRMSGDFLASITPMRAWERGAFFGVAVCSGMDDHDHISLGLRNGWGSDVPFFMTLPDRRQHTYVVGKTGTGKSSFLLNLIYQDIHSGRGVGVIDPHGTLADEVLACVPKWRAEDVVYFNPGE